MARLCDEYGHDVELVDLGLSSKADTCKWRLRCLRCGWEGLETQTRIEYPFSSFLCLFGLHDNRPGIDYVASLHINDPHGISAITHRYKIKRCRRCRRPFSAELQVVRYWYRSPYYEGMIPALDTFGNIARDSRGDIVWATKARRTPDTVIDGGVSVRAHPILDNIYHPDGGVQCGPPSTACRYCAQDPAPSGKPCPGCGHVNGPGRACPSCGIKRAYGHDLCPGCGNRMAEAGRNPVLVATARAR